jgi:hypothetical protein
MSDRRHVAALWLVRWALLAALWLALNDSRALPELVAAAAIAALGATFAALIARPGPPRTVAKSLAVLRLGPRRFGRPLLRLIPDTALVAAALWRKLVRRERVAGRLRVLPIREEPPLASAAGRVAIEAWGSLAPNRYVIGIDDRAGVVVVHELVPTAEPHFHPLGGT